MDCCCQTVNPSVITPKLKVIDYNRRVGCHVDLQQTLFDTLIQPQSEGCHCVQLYLGNRQAYSCRVLSAEDREQVCKYCDEHNKTFYVHCPLVTFSNLSNMDSVTKSINVVSSELQRVQDLPGACVCHMGKCGPNGSIETLVSSINDIQVQRGHHPRMEKQLLMETAAGQGSELGKNWEEIRHFFEGIDTNTIGLCLDTQHLYASGMCDFQTHESVVRLFDQADEACPKALKLFHLNDSKKPFGSRVDRHEQIRQGYIWSHNDEGLKALFSRCFEEGIDLILETRNPDIDLQLIRKNYM